MRVKICGLTNLKNAEVASKAGANYLGFIINYPKSARSMKVIDVANIVFNIKQSNRDVKFVGVFVDQDIDFVKRTGIECQLDVIQLHGNESVGYCKKLNQQFEIWKTIILKTQKDLNKIDIYKKATDKILLDSGMGSGKQINIDLLKQVKKINILAGGIGLDNIDKIKKFNPDMIDINSKIESRPGLKNEKNMQDIILKVKKL